MDRNKPMIAVGEQNRFFFPPNLLSTFFKEEKTDEIVGFIEFLPDFYGSPMTHRNKIMRVVRQNVWNGWNSVEIPSTQEFQLSRSRDNGRKKNTSPANTTSQTRAKQTPKRQTNVPGKDGREKKSRDNTRGPGARQAGELKKMSCVASLHCIPAVCAAIERRDIRPCCRRGQQKHKQEPLLSSSRLLSLSLSVSFSFFCSRAHLSTTETTATPQSARPSSANFSFYSWVGLRRNPKNAPKFLRHGRSETPRYPSPNKSNSFFVFNFRLWPVSSLFSVMQLASITSVRRE